MLGSEPSEAIEEQLKAIEMVTDVALRHLDVDDLLKELLDRVASIMAVDTVAVLLLEPESEILIARAAWGIEEEVRQGVRVAMGHGFAGRIAASRKPLAIERVDSTTVTNPLLWEKGIQAMLGVPLLSGDELLGVLHVGSMVERRFSDVETRLLTIVAGRVAGAVQARQLEVERTAARAACCLPGCPRYRSSSSPVVTYRPRSGGSEATGMTLSNWKMVFSGSWSGTSSATGCGPPW
jgi:phosphoserine phosphatase RsbU/P